MTTLALTGSLGPFRIGLRTADGQVRHGTQAGGTRPDLAASVAATCAQAGLRPDHIDQLVVDVGPGSYTGLRVATTFANTCRALAGVKVAALTSLEIAAAALSDPPAKVLIVLDARRGRWHHAWVSIDEGIRLDTAPTSAPVDEVLAELQTRIERSGDIEIISDPSLHARLAEVLGARARLRPIQPVDGVTMFDDRLQPRATEANLEPLYLMGSYAEIPHADDRG